MMLFLGLNVAAPTVLYRSIMADVSDHDEVHTGRRRTGLFYALLTFSNKVGSALAIGAMYWALALIGFKATGGNTVHAVRGLNVIFIAVPFVCNIFVALIMWNFPIGLSEQQELRGILDRRTMREPGHSDHLASTRSGAA
jgi:GPH family glycoside/pentoside/hexuronide:cation symporter